MNTRVEELEDKLFEPGGIDQLSLLISEGDTDAMYVLGMAYYEADGVSRDTAKSIDLLEMAATLGHIKALHDLGCFYYYGYSLPEGFVDHMKTRELLTLSSESGYEPSLTFLGSMWAVGEGGPKSKEKARELYKKAIQLGSDLGKKLLTDLENA